MDLSISRWQQRTTLRRPLAEIAIGAVVAMALSSLAQQWMGFNSAYAGLVFLLYAALAGVLLWSWARQVPGNSDSDRPQAARQPWVSLGWANRVTLTRSILILLIAAAVPFPDIAQQYGWTLAMVSLLALLLDGVDGMVARRTGTESAWGARFDMEMDAVFILALSMLLVSMGQAGLWVLLLGAMRYAFVGAGQIWPWMQRSLPPSFRRPAVCVWQVATLLVCLVPIVPGLMVTLSLLVALLLLAMSFAVDVWWLYQHRDEPWGDSDAN